MQRFANESFEAYKTRRAEEGAKLKAERRRTAGGTLTSRESFRNTMRAAGKLKGMYGANLRQHFDSVR